MDEKYLKQIAAQLRRPTGDFGNEVALNMNASNRAMNLNTIDALTVQNGDVVLEIGMANGMFVKDILAKARDVRYIGCDYSEDMVKIATNVNKDVVAAGIAYFHTAEAHQLPMKDNSADTIITVNTLYFWDDQSLVLKEMHRVLKQDGTLAISIRPESCMLKYPSTQYNFNYFEKEDVQELLTENSFRVFDVIEASEPEIEVDGKSFIPEHLIVLAHPV